MPTFRTGTGYDIHSLAGNRKLILGGVTLDYPKGLSGHSDGDALTHAVIDALLGAAGLPDIGEQFPDTDEKYRGISSMKLLEEAFYMVKDIGYVVANVDSTVIAQEPKLSGAKEKMKKNLALMLHTEEENVSVKAKTAEGMGPVGRLEAIEAHAIVLLEKK